MPWALPSNPRAFITARFRPRLTALDDRITPTLSFANQQVFSVGSDAEAVAVADFNADGRPDVAVANKHVGGTVTILLDTAAAGATLPSFTAAVPFLVGTDPAALAVGDFNGDGRTDVITANNLDNTVSILLNTAAPGAAASFAAQQTFAVGNGPRAVVVADFNKDGRPDFAAANAADNTVSVRLSTTAVGGLTATFSAAQTFAVGTDPSFLAVADFTGDGRPDLVSADATANGVPVLRNITADGAGVADFAPAVTLTFPTAPTGLAVGDVNGDARADLAVTTAANTVLVLTNLTTPGLNSTPAFVGLPAIPVGNGPNALAVGDFTGDGRADLAVTNATDATVSVVANTTAAGSATPTFAAQLTFAVDPGPVGLAVADFNGDGRADLVNGTVGILGEVAALLNTSTGGTVTGPVLDGQFGATGVWRYNRTTGVWVQLTAGNADALATAPNGNVIASFPGYGVWYYRPTVGWVKLHTDAAAAVAIDPLGNAYAGFAGYGTYAYRLASNTWVRLTGSVANILAASATGDVAANFPGFGVYRYDLTAGWVSLVTPNAVALGISGGGDIVAGFDGYGTYQFHTGTWSRIGVTTTQLAVGANGDAVANWQVPFGTGSVGKYDRVNGGWSALHGGTAVVTLAADLYGNVFATFVGYGVYEYHRYSGWRRVRTTEAATLRVG